MLPTLQDLYPWLIALWLMEGVILVRPLHFVLVSHLGRRFTVRAPGLRLAGLLPVSRSFLAHHASVGLTAEGITVLTNRFPTEAARYERESFAILPYEAIGGVTAEGSTIRWDKRHETRLPSAAFASLLMERVRELVTLDPRRRAEKLASYEAKSFDAEAAIRLGEDLARPVALLKGAATSVFLLVLVLYPVLVYAELATYRWLALWLIALLSAQLTVFVFACRLNREMKKRGLNVNAGLLPWMLVYPPAAMHAPNSLTRDLYQVFDHVTVAAAILPRRQAIRLIRSELYGIRHAEATSDEKTWIDCWKRRRRELVALIQRQGWSEDEVLAAPERSDPVAARFCPLCHAEYVERAETCTDCRFELVKLGIDAEYRR